GGSHGWGWHAYRNASFEIDGEVMPSVPGGTHWGGGIRISARDQARFGLLIQRRGTWDGREILSEDYIDAMVTPCAIKSDYGYLWWLNTGRELFPGAPETSVYAIGAGGNNIWVDTDHDLTVVTRWLDTDHASDFMAVVIGALS
ncbi:MAG: serine hydrolase, partial [Pseudomonadota bacterium]|nr:serine hydrolase [Pseudomonadota bacterium]